MLMTTVKRKIQRLPGLQSEKGRKRIAHQNENHFQFDRLRICRFTGVDYIPVPVTIKTSSKPSIEMAVRIVCNSLISLTLCN